MATAGDTKALVNFASQQYPKIPGNDAQYFNNQFQALSNSLNSVLQFLKKINLIAGPTTSIVNDLAVWNDTTGDTLVDMTWATATSKLSIFASAAQGVVPGSGGGTVNFLRADGTWATPPNSGGTVTGPVSSTVGDIAAWNNSGGTLLKDITWATATSLLSAFTSGAQGVVPASGGGTTNFLRADGSWAAPPAPSQTMVLLNTLTASNSASLQDTSSYTAYSALMIVFQNIVPATTSVSFTMGWKLGGTFTTSGFIGFVNGEGQSGPTALDGDGTTAFFNKNALVNSGAGLSGHILIPNPNASNVVSYVGDTVYETNTTGPIYECDHIGGYNATVGPVTGLEFQMSAGNITSGAIKIYGII